MTPIYPIGGAVYNGKIYFAPAHATFSGYFDPATNTFTETAFSQTSMTMYQYCGVGVLKDKVYYGPSAEKSVGVLDTTTNSFTREAATLSGYTPSATTWWMGAITHLSKIYFTPYGAHSVGVFQGPTPNPTATPTAAPTSAPTTAPSAAPTAAPTVSYTTSRCCASLLAPCMRIHPLALSCCTWSLGVVMM